MSVSPWRSALTERASHSTGWPKTSTAMMARLRPVTRRAVSSGSRVYCSASMSDPGVFRDAMLEPLGPGTERQAPGAQDLGDGLDVALIDIGRRHRDQGFRAHRLPRRRAAAGRPAARPLPMHMFCSRAQKIPGRGAGIDHVACYARSWRCPCRSYLRVGDAAESPDQSPGARHLLPLCVTGANVDARYRERCLTWRSAIA